MNPRLIKNITVLLALIATVLALDECFQPALCNKVNMAMVLKSDDNDITLTWTYNSSETFYGFQIRVLNSESDIVYQSPILHIRDRSMDFMADIQTGKNTVCLLVYSNVTQVIAQTCEDLKVSDMKIVVGILAGTIFLVPCLIILGIFIYKDKQIRNSEYQKLMSGYGNKSFVSEEEASGHKLTYVVANQHKAAAQAIPTLEIYINTPGTGPQPRSSIEETIPYLGTDDQGRMNTDKDNLKLEVTEPAEKSEEDTVSKSETNDTVALEVNNQAGLDSDTNPTKEGLNTDGEPSSDATNPTLQACDQTVTKSESECGPYNRTQEDDETINYKLEDEDKTETNSAPRQEFNSQAEDKTETNSAPQQEFNSQAEDNTDTPTQTTENNQPADKNLDKIVPGAEPEDRNPEQMSSNEDNSINANDKQETDDSNSSYL